MKFKNRLWTVVVIVSVLLLVSEIANAKPCSGNPFSSDPNDYSMSVGFSQDRYNYHIYWGKLNCDFTTLPQLKQYTGSFPDLKKQSNVIPLEDRIFIYEKNSDYPVVIYAKCGSAKGDPTVFRCIENTITQEPDPNVPLSKKYDEVEQVIKGSTMFSYFAYYAVDASEHSKLQLIEFSGPDMITRGKAKFLNGEDADNDGIYDKYDNSLDCQNPGQRPCLSKTIGGAIQWVPAETLDADADGVIDSVDKCLGTTAGATVNADGCSDAQLAAKADADGDGVADGVDNCPNTPKGAEVDVNGCSEAQLATATPAPAPAAAAPRAFDAAGPCALMPGAVSNPAILLLFAALAPLAWRRKR